MFLGVDWGKINLSASRLNVLCDGQRRSAALYSRIIRTCDLYCLFQMRVQLLQFFLLSLVTHERNWTDLVSFALIRSIAFRFYGGDFAKLEKQDCCPYVRFECRNHLHMLLLSFFHSLVDQTYTKAITEVQIRCP